jgi:hypothetical protein
MGWAVFLIGCVVTIPVGWALFTRPRADRFLSAVGLVLLAPTIWAAALGLRIGPCDTPICVTHKQQDLLLFAVAGLVLLAVGLVLVAAIRPIPGAAVLTLAAVLVAVSTWKIDKVTTIMFGLLAATVLAYTVLGLLPNRPEPGYPTG